jgi:hypothetical protein
MLTIKQDVEISSWGFLYLVALIVIRKANPRGSGLFIHVYSSKEGISISVIASNFSFRPAFFAEL